MTDLRPRRHKSVRKRNKQRPQRNVEFADDDDDRDEALIGAADDKPPATVQGKPEA